MTSLRSARAAAREAFANGAPAREFPPPKLTKLQFKNQPAGQAAKDIGYERSAPRCECCKHYKPEKTVVTAQTRNLPVLILPAVCKRGSFLTRPGAICDYWTGQDGSVLEIPGSDS